MASQAVRNVTGSWDSELDASRSDGERTGSSIAQWDDLPDGDGEQLLREVAEAWLGAALRAFRAARGGE